MSKTSPVGILSLPGFFIALKQDGPRSLRRIAARTLELLLPVSQRVFPAKGHARYFNPHWRAVKGVTCPDIKCRLGGGRLPIQK